MSKWKLVKLLHDLELNFSEQMLLEVTNDYNDGMDINDIAEKYNLEPDRIFIALFHQARRDKITRPYAKKLKGEIPSE